MKFSAKKIWIITVLLTGLNGLLFINRNKGFEYRKYSVKQELYPPYPDSSFFKKWMKANSFSVSDQQSGKSLLRQHIGIDTLKNDFDKLIRISRWLYQSLFHQLGTPSGKLSGKTALEQYHYLAENKKEQFYCGQFQSMLGLFCTAAGITNRYVEVLPRKGGGYAGVHEINEVYLIELKQWVMIDLTRNFFLIGDNDRFFSAATYLDFRQQNKNTSLIIHSLDTLTGNVKASEESGFVNDSYFNRDYILRYYLTRDLQKVYKPLQKIKRYVLPQAWYELYDPLNTSTNLFFRIRQCLFFLLLVWVVFITAWLIRQAGTKNQKLAA